MAKRKKKLRKMRRKNVTSGMTRKYGLSRQNRTLSQTDLEKISLRAKKKGNSILKEMINLADALRKGKKNG